MRVAFLRCDTLFLNRWVVMQNFQLIAVCVSIAIITYFYGRARIIKQANIAQSRPNSLPVFYGLFPALLSLIVPLIIMAIWLVSESVILNMMLLKSLPDALTLSEEFSSSVALAQIHNLADGISVGEVEEWVKDGVAHFIAWKSSSNIMMNIAAIASSLVCSLYGIRRVGLNFRARNAVERIIYLGLIACSIVAIFTTIGIVFSVIFESIRFFRLIPPLEFLTGLTWNPEFEGAAGRLGSRWRCGLWLYSAFCRDIFNFGYRANRGDTDWPVISYLSVRICQQIHPLYCETCFGNSGWCAHRRIWLFCRPDHRTAL